MELIGGEGRAGFGVIFGDAGLDVDGVDGDFVGFAVEAGVDFVVSFFGSFGEGEPVEFAAVEVGFFAAFPDDAVGVGLACLLGEPVGGEAESMPWPRPSWMARTLR